VRLLRPAGALSLGFPEGVPRGVDRLECPLELAVHLAPLDELAAHLVDHGHVLDADGAVEKWVPGVQQLTFNGKYACERGQQVLFVTDRAVFDLSADGLRLTEIAPGMSLQEHVLARIGFPVRVSPDLKLMDARLFRAEPMGLLAEFGARAPMPRGAQYSSPKRTP
jgi:hypothetical protein